MSIIGELNLFLHHLFPIEIEMVKVLSCLKENLRCEKIPKNILKEDQIAL